MQSQRGRCTSCRILAWAKEREPPASPSHNETDTGVPCHASSSPGCDCADAPMQTSMMCSATKSYPAQQS